MIGTSPIRIFGRPAQIACAACILMLLLVIYAEPACGQAASVKEYIYLNGRIVAIESSSNACSYSISPGSATIGPGVGSGSIAITVGSGCSWTATSNNPSWIAVTGGSSGSGNGTVSYSVAANTGDARSGSITIGDQAFAISQAQYTCSYAISPTSISYEFSGGTGNITVTAGSGCAWTATSNNPSWITVTGGSSGSGNGTVSYSVAANTGGARSGSITIGGQTFSINQGAAPSCSYAISPTSINLDFSGASGNVSVSTTSGCSWTAVSNNPSWITVTGGGSGSGNGTVSYSVGGNTGSARSGSITIAGQTFSVNQAAYVPGQIPAPVLWNATAYPSSSQIWIQWDMGSYQAASFEVERTPGGIIPIQYSGGGGLAWPDSNVTTGVTYVYRIRAKDAAGNPGPYSNRDVATMVAFTNNPVTAGTTIILAQHVTELRQAIAGVRTNAGLGAPTWTDTNLTGMPVKAVHLTEMRNQLNQALDALQITRPLYTDDPIVAGVTTIKAVHIQEIRNAIK